jgi:cell division protein FtsB
MPRRRRPSRSALALRWLTVAVFVAIAVAYVHPLRAYLEARGDVDRRRGELAQLEGENTGLERKLERAGQREFVEREARKLGLVRPGERLYIVRGVGTGREASLR